jgi:hypothetical protein
VSTQATAIAGWPYSFILFGCRTYKPGGSSQSQQKQIPILIFILTLHSNVHVASCSSPLDINRLKTLSLSCVLRATPIISKAQRALQTRVDYVSETYPHARRGLHSTSAPRLSHPWPRPLFPLVCATANRRGLRAVPKTVPV